MNIVSKLGWQASTMEERSRTVRTVSYTHLTLPTILLV